MRLFKVGNKPDVTEWHEYFLWLPSLVKTGQFEGDPYYEIRWLEKVMRRCEFVRVFDDQGEWEEEYETKEYFDKR